MQTVALWPRLLFSLIVLFVLAACGERDDGVTPGAAIGAPARIPLTAEPVKVSLDRGIRVLSSFTVTLYSTTDELIGKSNFFLNASSSATLGGIPFNYASAGSNGGTLTFSMDQAQYDSVKSRSGRPLGRIGIAWEDGGVREITGFGAGWLQFKNAYTYAFADEIVGPTFEYLAEPDRLAGITKYWVISQAGKQLQAARDACAVYADFQYAPELCVTEYRTRSVYTTSFREGMPAGVYDVNVSTTNTSTGAHTGDFTTKLIVGRRPVARMRLTNSVVSTVGSALFYDATASQADPGSVVAYTLAKPAGSTAVLANEDTRTPSLVADVPGTYTLTLTVSFNGATDTVSVERVVFPRVTGASGS